MSTLRSARSLLARSVRAAAAAIAVAFVLAMLVPVGASADFGIRPDPSDPTHPDFHMSVVQADHVTPYTQAGGHNFELTTSLNFNTLPSGEPEGRARDIVVELPTGLVGDPTAVPQCRFVDLRNNADCSPDAQIGFMTLSIFFGFPLTSPPWPLYNIERSPGDAATFGLNFFGVVIVIHNRVRSGSDYGVSATIPRVSELLPLVGSSVTLWGIPQDASHDTERFCASGSPCPSNAPRKALLTNPSDCSAAPQATVLHVDPWDSPDTFQTYTDTPASGVTGCEKLRFEPLLTVRPTVSNAGAPSGYVVHLQIPQDLNPDAAGTPPVRRTVVSLPEGVRVSPSAADGLQGCSDAQIALHEAKPGQCPSASKIGTVKIVTPLLPDPLEGAIYQGTQTSTRLFRIFLEAEGDGVRVKLPGAIDVDPVTGQITSTFDNTPQLPFSDLYLTFKGGPRAPLSNPPTCGMFTTTSVLTPWSAPITPMATPSDSFAISSDGHGAPCPGTRRFEPTFVAGTTNPVAAADTAFTLTVARDDQDQEFRSVAVKMPRGLLGHIASVSLCPRAQAAVGTCGEGSKLGSVMTGSGAGSNPLFLPGRVYLTGPYKGAPFGLSIVVPAVAGPFDLGTVVVRSAIFVDRHTAALRVVSDPLPTILKGVPLQVRSVNITVDRPKFIINPTNCEPLKINGAIGSTQGATAHVSSRFQVGDCAALPLKPRMKLSVGGRGHTAKHASTPLTATLTQTPGQANLRSVAVALPEMLNARLDIVNRACTQAEFDAGHCSARAGSAVAVTPLLKHALRGGVYFVKDPNAPAGGLPNLVVALRGQVDFDLVGKIKIPGGTKLATRFVAPDVPITRFTLSLLAGANGPLGNAANLCAPASRRARASIAFHGQNGTVLQRSQRLIVHGCHRR